LDWITGTFIVALPFNVSLYLCPFFRAGPFGTIKIKIRIRIRIKSGYPKM
jgi:hypothetical protein